MATQGDIETWTRQSGRDWNQSCEAYISHLCETFGVLNYYPPSAIDAYYVSAIQSFDAYSCPPGGIIWLDIGTYGHVQIRVDSSDANGTSNLQQEWGINAGLSALDWYCSVTGASPLGWSWDNAGSHVDYQSGSAAAAAKGEDGAMQYWRYAETGAIVALDNVAMQYRFLNEYEVMVVMNLESAGLTQIATFSEPAWSDTLSNFKSIERPE